MAGPSSSFKGSANTGPAFYISEKAIEEFCSKERSNIETECGEKREASQAQTRNASLENEMVSVTTPNIKSRVRALDRMVKSSYGYKRREGENAWIEDHCYGLWLKPMGGKDFTFDKVINNIESHLSKTFPKDSPPPAALEPHFREIERMRLPAGHKDRITSSTVLAEMMTAAVKANPCIQARRCVLVPYKNTEGKSAPGEKQEGSTEKPKSKSIPAGEAQANSGAGCCPGQTGHHVLPGAMFGEGKKLCGEPYSHSQAPVVCLEGAGNQVGSHGTAHEALETTMNVYKETGATTISYKDACEQGIAAVRKVNPLCREECLQAQLDAHYDEKLKCKDAQLIPHSGMGGKEKKKNTDDSPSPIPSTADI